MIRFILRYRARAHFIPLHRRYNCARRGVTLRTCAYTTPTPHPGYRDRTEHLPGDSVVLEEDNESLMLKRTHLTIMLRFR